MVSFINDIQQQQQQQQNKINESNDNYYNNILSRINNNTFRINNNTGKSTQWFNRRLISQLTHDKVNVPHVHDASPAKKVLFQVKFKDSAFEKMRILL